MDRFDVCIVGAGVIGLAIACELSRHSRMRGRSVVVLERESSFGQHTSSRNSEVIHAGIYYPQNSLKARLCVRGKQLLYEHSERCDVPYRKIGKLIVAQDAQREELEQIVLRAEANGVTDLAWLDQEELARREPAVNASAALLSPSTGIIDSHSYMDSLLRLAEESGVQFAPYTEVVGVEPNAAGFQIDCRILQRTHKERYSFVAATLINSAGLEAQALAGRIAGFPAERIPPLHLCKGDYFAYTGQNPFQHLIYPVPEKNTTGLGIHGTLDLSGQLRFGPDAHYVETLDYTIDPNKASRFAESIARYFPAISAQQLVPAYAGMRPKLVPADSPAVDFLIEEYSDDGFPGLLQLFGIESPGLTASLAIGEYVTGLVTARLD